MSYGKPSPGVPVDPVDPRVVRADIDAARAVFGLPALAPATDTRDDPPLAEAPDLATVQAALATIERVQILLDEIAGKLARWIAAQEGQP